ncbi:glycoside hydrolase family 3 N-terminal domain-containing protein [Dermacoccaceae bacterium W4C1]
MPARTLLPGVLALSFALSACSPSGSDGDGSSAADEPGNTAAGSGTAAPTASAPATGTSTGGDTGSQSAADSPSMSGSASSTSGQSSAAAGTPADASCAGRVVSGLTLDQRIGQLVMVGLQKGAPTSAVTSLIAGQHVGNVLFLGGWSSTSEVSTVAGQVQAAATGTATGGVRMIVAADQEGGAVWQLRDPGTPRLPSALQQGKTSPQQRVAYGRQIGALLTKAGVNTNLAPVADTVPASNVSANKPIGVYGREYGSTPEVAGPAVADLVKGLHAGGVATTLKHFPGLGRVTGNTDFSSTGIVDSTATRTDPYLAPFKRGIDAGSELVMVSSARYPKIDASNQALFSSAIITDVLRGDLGFTGVVITDDVNAVAVRSVPAGQRATRFVSAGGDILLTGNTADVAPMVAALKAKASAEPAFKAKVDAAATRVVAMKLKRGLATCG